MGFFLVNVVPWLQYLPTWFPGTGFLRLSKRGRELGTEMRNRVYDTVKQNVVSNYFDQNIHMHILHISNINHTVEWTSYAVNSESAYRVKQQ